MFYIATAVLLELFLGIFDLHQSDKNDYFIGQIIGPSKGCYS